MQLSRRSLLGAATGAGVGLAASGLTFAEAAASADVKTLRSLQTSFQNVPPSHEIRPLVASKNLVDGVKGAKFVEGAITEIKTVTGNVIAKVATFVCSASNPNSHLGFSARCLTFRVRDIAWQAGGGWPIYTSYCPRRDYEGGMRFRDHYRHQVVPRFGGAVWHGCPDGSASGCGQRSSPVIFCVNDGAGDYADNRGVFVVDVIAWSN